MLITLYKAIENLQIDFKENPPIDDPDLVAARAISIQACKRLQLYRTKYASSFSSPLPSEATIFDET